MDRTSTWYVGSLGSSGNLAVVAVLLTSGKVNMGLQTVPGRFAEGEGQGGHSRGCVD